MIGFIPFPRVLVLCEMQSVSSMIWTCVDWGCRIPRLHLCRRVRPIKVVRLRSWKFGERWILLHSYYFQIHTREVAPDKVLSMDQKQLLDYINCVPATNLCKIESLEIELFGLLTAAGLANCFKVYDSFEVSFSETRFFARFSGPVYSAIYFFYLDWEFYQTC